MIDWIINSSIQDERYLENVKRIVEPYMDYVCEKLYISKNLELDKIEEILREIVETLPIFKISINNNFIELNKPIYERIIINYNSYTNIEFNSKCIVRDIKLRKILE